MQRKLDAITAKDGLPIETEEETSDMTSPTSGYNVDEEKEEGRQSEIEYSIDQSALPVVDTHNTVMPSIPAQQSPFIYALEVVKHADGILNRVRLNEQR